MGLIVKHDLILKKRLLALSHGLMAKSRLKGLLHVFPHNGVGGADPNG